MVFARKEVVVIRPVAPGTVPGAMAIGAQFTRENLMTVRIVDRRFDSRNKSSVNRTRFIRRFKGQIRKAVGESINRRGVRDLSYNFV